MPNFKAALGWLPSRFASRRMERGGAAERGRWLEFVNARPSWFMSVPRRLKVSTKFGFPIWCDRWDVIGQAILRTGQWEGLLSRTITACLKPGDLALDVGANMGYDAMLMSQAVGESGRVLAFEPDHGNLEMLLLNLTGLAHRNVVVNSFALSDAASLAEIAIAGEGNRGQSNLRPTTHGQLRLQPVLATRLDDLLLAAVERRIALVKIDVEGYEQKVIDGMSGLLDKIDVLTCEIDPSYLKACGSDANRLFETLWRAGFVSYCAQPNSDGKWQPGGPDFRIEVAHSQHFDALFCRSVDNPKLDALMEAC